MFPTHSPTKTRTRSPLRRLATAAATTLLAAGGLTGLGAIAASPAHAASARPANAAAFGSGCQLTVLGQTVAYPVNSTISCTSPSYGTWYTGETQTQTADATLHNVSSFAIRLVPIQYSAPVAPGNKSWHIGLIPSSGVTLNPGQAVTVSVQTTFDGPYQSDVQNGYVYAEIDFNAYSSQWSRPAGISSTPAYPAVDTAAPAPTYSLAASASTSSPQTGSGSTITVKNTGSADEHLTLCADGKAIAAGIHSPGTSLTHTVVESTPGTRTFTAYAGASFSCSGSSKTVSIDWTGSTPTPTPTPTSGLSPLAVAGHPAEPVGQPDMLYVGDTQKTGSPAEWLTACVNGRAVASGLHVPGGVLAHPVTVSTLGGTVTVDAYSGSTPASCSGSEQTFVVTGEPAGPALAVPNLHAFAAATSAKVGTSVPIYVTDTASGPTWVTLCEAGRPVASAWKYPGQGMPHDVVSSTTGSVSYVAMQGRASCTGGEEANISIDWTAGS